MKSFIPIDKNRLCKDCKHKGYVKVGQISYIYYCKVHKGNFSRGKGLGINICSKKPHPQCPLTTGEFSDAARRMLKRGIPM